MNNKEKIFNQRVNEAFDSLDPVELELTRISFDIAERLHDILDEKGMWQKDLAQLMGKKESEVSRWLKGMHNFTMKTVVKLEFALQKPIIGIIGASRSANETVSTPVLRAMTNSPSGMAGMAPMTVAKSAVKKSTQPQAA
ncbi:MAG: XRE family transcriptional regulator [Cryomorphaceae bacterium]|nr:MAG: XRE family transcriptional regulator [Cryomorphaceae bacterium]